MDLRKAFDTVSHSFFFLKKLYHYGVRGPAYALIKSYLSSRNQFVIFNNFSSSIDIGVPQGSILGPLLFLVYVNDIAHATFSKPGLFADDPCLVLSNTNITNLESSCNRKLTKLLN